MTKIKPDPMFISISGKTGNFVFYMRKGIMHSRSRIIPLNPRTPLQQKNRSLFSQAVKAWQVLPDATRMIYNLRAKGKTQSGYNIFISEYMKTNKIRIVDCLSGNTDKIMHGWFSYTRNQSPPYLIRDCYGIISCFPVTASASGSGSDNIHPGCLPVSCIISIKKKAALAGSLLIFPDG